jgi:hypothetical protein
MPDLTVAEQMLYSTVKLTALKGGVATSTGTGFFMELALRGDKMVPVIVTNKHVVKDSDQIVAVCHFANEDGSKPSGRLVTCTIHTGTCIVNHPDSTVDLCVILIGDIMLQAQSNGTPLFLKRLVLDMIPADDDWQYFDAIEDVTMIGCPNGISDEVNNLPIVRRGITASSLNKDYNGKKEFMVDMACFPGSSGSPIFLYDKSGYLDRKQNSYVMGQTRLHLVGILYAGPLVTNTGQIILAQPPKVAVSAMMHLGNAIKASPLWAIDAEVRRLVTPPAAPEAAIAPLES